MTKGALLALALVVSTWTPAESFFGGYNSHTAFARRGSEAFSAANDGDGDGPTDFGDVGFVLLAGGKGSRMKATKPKQFLSLRGMPILDHSIELFLDKLPEYAENRGKR